MVIMAGSLLLQGFLYILLNSVFDRSIYLDLIDQLMLPGSGEVFIYQPWSVITHPFFQHPQLFSLMSVLVSFMLIWLFGRIHQQMLGDIRTRRLVIFSVPVIGILTVLSASLLTMSKPEMPAELAHAPLPQQENTIGTDKPSDSAAPAEAEASQEKKSGTTIDRFNTNPIFSLT